MAAINDVIDLKTDGNIAVVSVNSPPVNALSQNVREGLHEAVTKALADPKVDAIVVRCDGRTFIAGADIREFGKPLQPPDLNSVIARYESSPKLVVAAIHGTALGGGLETAFGCHYRCAVAAGQVGFPEVKLGILPGAGGTQRRAVQGGHDDLGAVLHGGDDVVQIGARGRLAELADVGAGDEGAPAADQHDSVDVGILAEGLDPFLDAVAHGGGQCVHRRVVDGEDADPPLGGAKHCVGHGVLP